MPCSEAWVESATRYLLSHAKQFALSQVLARVTSGIDESNSVSSTLKKVAMVLAPSLLSAFQQLSLARVAGKAVLDGTCVFLFAGILCHQINEA